MGSGALTPVGGAVTTSHALGDALGRLGAVAQRLGEGLSFSAAAFVASFAHVFCFSADQLQ